MGDASPLQYLVLIEHVDVLLIQGIEAKLAPKTHLEPLMAIRWAVRYNGTITVP